jgi:hypothetical protein
MELKVVRRSTHADPRQHIEGGGVDDGDLVTGLGLAPAERDVELRSVLRERDGVGMISMRLVRVVQLVGLETRDDRLEIRRRFDRISKGRATGEGDEDEPQGRHGSATMFVSRSASPGSGIDPLALVLDRLSHDLQVVGPDRAGEMSNISAAPRSRC